jgi:N-acetylmuramoyl-L-alanine amidase
MREIKYIVIHCTAGPVNQPTSELQNYWKNMGWKKPGYHLLVSEDSYDRLAEDEEICNGVAGNNKHSIHISYKGGWEKGKPVDNRNEYQKKTLLTLVRTMRHRYPTARILGHRDFSPDKNGNGVIDKPEWIKACPSFDVKAWLKENGIRDKIL